MSRIIRVIPIHNEAGMIDGFQKQAFRVGTDLRIGYVSAVDFPLPPYKITFDEKKVVWAGTNIIATGATPKWLGLDSEQKYAGCGYQPLQLVRIFL